MEVCGRPINMKTPLVLEVALDTEITENELSTALKQGL
jgi:hypothetical protein